ncbi:MAG: signal peptide peptidase SppA [Bacteroidales bacterium]|nr:signal peptide peptidase SppA [Bacteroidales bacterium]
MKNFFKYTLATILGGIITFFLAFLIFAGIIGGIVASSGDDSSVVVKENTILKIQFKEAIVDREPLDPMADFNFTGDKDNSIKGLNTILRSIKAAAEDDNISGIYLDVNTFAGGGLATLESVRNALLDFKTSGKFIYSYAEGYSQKAYYIASVSDSIFVNPAGSVEIAGIGAQLMFFKNALDKFGVEMQIIRGPNNKFKSAVEPFMYDKMSPANREQMNVFLGSIWNNMVAQMSESRGVSTTDFNIYIDSLWASDPNRALELNLIDGVKYIDEVREILAAKVGVEYKDMETISLADYSTTVSKKNVLAKEKIAVIYAVGEIKSGEGNDEIIGSDRIAKAVCKARKDTTIKAIVLRVNSPGGSALASEVMWRELVLAKNTKPLVVSMGNYAASGGYYIACMADKIVAQPNTLTGSIGVFGMIPNFKKLMNEKIGITTDQVSTNANSVMGVFTPLTPYQIKTIQKGVVRIYGTFISHVAEGRNMTVEQVDAIGQGRVWSGTNAVEIGLVDEIGNLDRAIEIAAEMANIEEYKIKELPKRKNPLEEMFKQFGSNVKLKLVKNELGDNVKYYNYLQTLKNMDGVQARLPYFIDIN